MGVGVGTGGGTGVGVGWGVGVGAPGNGVGVGAGAGVTVDPGRGVGVIVAIGAGPPWNAGALQHEPPQPAINGTTIAAATVRRNVGVRRMAMSFRRLELRAEADVRTGMRLADRRIRFREIAIAAVANVEVYG